MSEGIVTTALPQPERSSLIRIERRINPSPLLSILVPIGAVLLSLAVGALLTVLAGGQPLPALAALLLSPLSSIQGISEIFVKATPILLAALGVSVAFKAQFWNIGAEGQYLMGAFASTAVALLGRGLPAVILLPLSILAGFAGGALWGAIPAGLKLRFGANEVVVTLMMNYVAISWLEFLVQGPMRDPVMTFPNSPRLPDAAILPRLAGTRLHLGLLVAIVAVVLVFLILQKTVAGYEIRFLGANPTAARWAGIDVTRRTLAVMILSGGLAGIAGMVQTAGLEFRLKSGLAVGYGFTAITVALLGRLNPLAIPVAAVLMAALTIGGQYMQRALNIPYSLVDAISALIVFFLLGSDYLVKHRIRLNLRGQAK